MPETPEEGADQTAAPVDPETRARADRALRILYVCLALGMALPFVLLFIFRS